jgi:hypothetical protein
MRGEREKIKLIIRKGGFVLKNEVLDKKKTNVEKKRNFMVSG